MTKIKPISELKNGLKKLDNQDAEREKKSLRDHAKILSDLVDAYEADNEAKEKELNNLQATTNNYKNKLNAIGKKLGVNLADMNNEKFNSFVSQLKK